MLAYDPGRPVSPTEVVDWFNVTPQVIYRWAQRGLIVAADHKGKRDGARYWITDLRNAEKKTRENPKSKRFRANNLISA